MNIVILGAGTVGSSIAELLCRNRHDVTVVDSNPKHLQRIKEELDLKALTGSASEASVLFQAGVMTADLCLAVTGYDEVNMVGASLAKAMGTARAVARVYAPVFRDLSTFDYTRHFHIDKLVSLEHLSAMELARGIRHAGSIAVENFARGDLKVQELEVQGGAPTLGIPLKEMGLPRTVRIGSIWRNERLKIAGADDKLDAGDRITVIGTHKDVNDISDRFQHRAPARLGVVIAGGGETGFHLARILDSRHFSVVLMEADRERCESLAVRLPHVTVVHSNCTVASNLEEERVGSADVFVACTGDDENNIMSCVEAGELGAKTLMAIVGRPDYANVMGKLGITHAVSPRQVISKQVLAFLTTGPVVSSTPLADGTVSVLEIEVGEGVPATEHVLAKLQLPRECLISAVLRDDFARVPGADDRLQAGDTVVALCSANSVQSTLKLFDPNGRSR